ncbi:hypothetical protein LZD49_20135 [Dyadobacter sp. CY261]|uniref:hypothetical protein n=1 Tax=Dyadobacter sp. CY261 TaxID=2907203 RepID=UPI001F1D909A|nr:hypothetical protein [Dyadobacter sp. CY261]MCF0072801.1 hypothetical protein [Dyadobacter sp. CY261]
MKKLIMAIVALAVSTAVTFAQSTTNSTNPNIRSDDTSKQNTSSDRSTVGPRNTSDGTGHRRQGKPEKATQAGRASNAGSRSNANNESKVSTGGKATQGYQSKGTADPANQPAQSRIGTRPSGDSSAVRKGGAKKGGDIKPSQQND